LSPATIRFWSRMSRLEIKGLFSGSKEGSVRQNPRLALPVNKSVHGDAVNTSVNTAINTGKETMNTTIETQIGQLQKLSATALRAKYRELFGETSRSSNRQFLFRRLAWRVQAIAEGDLSERARKRALEIANDADLTRRPGKAFLRLPEPRSARDQRLPPAGSVLRRIFKQKLIEVMILRRNGGFLELTDEVRATALSSLTELIESTETECAGRLCRRRQARDRKREASTA